MQYFSGSELIQEIPERKLLFLKEDKNLIIQLYPGCHMPLLIHAVYSKEI